MKRRDLRNQIVPTTIENIGKEFKLGNRKFNTTDLIYIDTYNEQYETFTKEERRISATDYAIMNNAFVDREYQTRLGKKSTVVWTRYSVRGVCNILVINVDGGWWPCPSNYGSTGLCPCMRYKLPSTDDEELDIREVKNENGKILYHTLQIGEYPRTNLDEELSQNLEELYNSGKIKLDIKVTGRWYSENGQKSLSKNFAGKHSPEFEYKGNRYVRVISNPYDSGKDIEYSNGTNVGKKGTVRWVKVEPISFIIRNWDDLPKSINPEGNGSAEYFDLIAEEVIIADIPYYPDYPGPRVENSDLWQNSMPRGFLNGIDVRNIKENGNPDFGAARGGNFTGNCNFLNEAFNLSREPIYEYVIPESETEIPDDAFNGCVLLKRIVIHSGITSIGKRAFDGLDFKYAYRLKTGEIILGEGLPENQTECESIIELGAFSGFDYNILLQRDKLEELIGLSKKLTKNKFCIPYILAKQLVDKGMVDSFCKNSDFRFFRNEIPDINAILLKFPEEERLDFFKFAWSLGCFSREKILNKNDRETEVILAQKATEILRKLLQTEEMQLGKYHGLFDSLPLGVKTTQEFLQFISEEKIEKKKDKNRRTIERKSKFENLEMLINLERTYSGIFAKVMANFDTAKSYRQTLNEDGKPIIISREKSLKNFYLDNKYKGITPENYDIAELFYSKGLSQQVFEKASELRKRAKQNNIPEHILEKQVTEETILETIERLKSQTETELASGKEMLEELWAKQFTYEWLSKNDPHNSIMGLFCGCCGNINSDVYGKDIAQATVIAPQVQNIVVRNSKGEIISKGTMYVNKERGYAVINDFELNQKYRNHEMIKLPGNYNVDENNHEEQEREMIFAAFQRGLEAFIVEYDRENPDRPLQQVNVGMGYNRLKRQVQRFKVATSNLSVPAEYQFQDAAYEQRVLYKREKGKIEDKRDAR